eukprot:10784573-Prorocentrum_lima.AAC.1
MSNSATPLKEDEHTWEKLKDCTPLAIPAGEPWERSIHFMNWVREIQSASRLVSHERSTLAAQCFEAAKQ